MKATRSQVRWAGPMACYVLLAGVFVYAGLESIRWPMVITDSPDNAGNLSAQVQTRIDPNVAPWQELARLPNVGEVMARDIVAYREEQLARFRDAGERDHIVFRSLADLDPIPGFGEKRLKRIEPYLKFPGTAAKPGS